MSFTHRFVKAAPSGKVEDRFLTLQVAKADDVAKAPYGTLFNLVEITSRWFPTSQIAQTIINTLRKEYYKGASTSDLENFENALKKVNEQLAAVAQNGETEWMGNLNAELVLLNGNDAHLCSTGSVRAFLVREGRVVPISEPRGQTGDEVHPLKTFSSITSGSLQDKDRLFFGSSALFEHINVDDIRRAMQDPSIYEATVSLVRDLQRQKIKNVGFGVIEILSDQSAAQKPLGEPEVVYIDQPVETIMTKAARIARTVLLPAAARTAVFGKKAALKAHEVTKTHVLPKTTAIAKQVHEQTRKTAADLISKGTPLAKQTLAQVKTKLPKTLPIGNAKPADEPVEGDSLIGKTIFNIHDYTAPAKPKRRLAIPLPSTLAFQRFLLFVRQKRNRPLVYIVSTIVLIFILVLSVSIQKKNEQASANVQQQKNQLEDARRRLEEGETALVFNNKKEAQLAFADAIKLAKEAAQSPKLADEAKKLIDQAEIQLDKLVGSNRLKNLLAVVNFAGASRIVVAQGKVVAIDTDKNEVRIADVVDGQTQTASGSVDGKLTAIHAAGETVYVATETAFYSVNLATNELDQRAFGDGATITKAADLGTFGPNIYFLAPGDNQIWRYPISNNVLQKQSPYFKGSHTITDAISMAIDGSVYVLGSNGKIQKYNQGNSQNFSLSGLPAGFEAIENPVTVFTSEESSSIYVVEGGVLPRILEFDKQGKFLQQFLFQSDLNDLKDVWFQSTGRKAWALFGNSVYELNL